MLPCRNVFVSEVETTSGLSHTLAEITREKPVFFVCVPARLFNKLNGQELGNGGKKDYQKDSQETLLTIRSG
jgi:hypothetical protein